MREHVIHFNSPEPRSEKVKGELLTEDGQYVIHMSSGGMYRIPFANVLYIKSFD